MTTISKFLATLFVLQFFSIFSWSQEVLWASKILGYSSEHRPSNYGTEYRATQILGIPNKLPDYGDSPCAWMPAQPTGSGEEWIKVGYNKSIKLKQIAIAENFNGGAIVRVYAYDTDGKEYLVHTQDGSPSKEPGNMFHIFITENLNIEANAIKIVLLPSSVNGQNQIDAIGISDSPRPIEAKINIASGLPENHKKENLGKRVNSASQEVAPFISPDGKTLYFTRGNHPENTGSSSRQDVWFSTMNSNGTWNKAQNLQAPVNNRFDNAVVGISSGGNTLFLINIYHPDGTMSNGLSRSVKGPDGWQQPVESRIINHYNRHKNNYTEFAVSPDERVLILSVQRLDTQGDKDLYVSFMQADGFWSEPRNIGKVVNTAAYEGSPFIAADGKTLYFTTTGKSGYGDGDIFMTKRLDDTWLNWSEPVNLGPEINTEQWDGFFTVPASGDYAYFSSTENSLGQEDIFRIRLSPALQPEIPIQISGSIFNSVQKTPVNATIEIEDSETGELLTSIDFRSASSKIFQLFLLPSSNYRMTVQSEGYFPFTEELNLKDDQTTRSFKKDIFIQPIQTGENITLSQIIFAQSSSEIPHSALKQLNQLADILKTHAQMEIIVEGHTDNQGDSNKNLQLSEDRVEAVKTYLTSQGIESDRIKTKAWGSSRPVSSNLTEEKRKLNRRVEFTILKM